MNSTLFLLLSKSADPDTIFIEPDVPEFPVRISTAPLLACSADDPERIESVPLATVSLVPEYNIADPPVNSCTPPEIWILPPAESPLETIMFTSAPFPATAAPPVNEMEPVSDDALDVPVLNLTAPLAALDNVSELCSSTLPLALDVEDPLEIVNVPPLPDFPEPAIMFTEPPFPAPTPALAEADPPFPRVDCPAVKVTPPVFVTAAPDSTAIPPACTGPFEVLTFKAPAAALAA